MDENTKACGVIENGVVVNAIVCCNPCGGPPCPFNAFHLTGDAWIGWTYADGTFSPPISASTVVAVTKLQFYKQAISTPSPSGTGTLWDAVQAYFATNPAAALEFNLASEIRADDPSFISAASELYGADAPQMIAEFFSAASLQ